MVQERQSRIGKVWQKIKQGLSQVFLRSRRLRPFSFIAEITWREKQRAYLEQHYSGKYVLIRD